MAGLKKDGCSRCRYRDAGCLACNYAKAVRAVKRKEAKLLDYNTESDSLSKQTVSLSTLARLTVCRQRSHMICRVMYICHRQTHAVSNIVRRRLRCQQSASNTVLPASHSFGRPHSPYASARQSFPMYLQMVLCIGSQSVG